MSGILDKIRAWWLTADRQQRVITISGLAMLAVLLGSVFFFSSRPKWSVLYGGLTDKDKFAMVSELQSMGVPVDYGASGALMVPADQVDRARMALANANLVPDGAHLGIDGFDKIGLLTTPEVERNKIRALLEGELAKSIRTTQGVKDALVHVSLGERALFADQPRAATASVKIAEAPGTSLSSEQGRVIATFVSQAVPGLDLKDVTVVNQRMEFLFNGEDMDPAKGTADSRLEIESQIAENRSRALTRVLEGVFGPGSVYVVVHPNVLLDEENRSSVRRTPSEEPERVQRVRETMSGANNRAVGVAGAASNMPGAAPAQPDGTAGSGSNYENEQKVENRPLNEETVQTRRATGELRGLMINVVADARRVDTPEEEEKLQSIVQGEIANQTEVQAFRTNVTVVEFDQSATQAAAAQASAAANQERIQQFLSILPLCALLLVALFVIKQISKLAKQASPTPVLAGVGGQTLVMGSGPDMASALESPDGGSLVSALEAGRARISGAEGGGGAEDESMHPEVKAIGDKFNLPLEQIKKMADDKPKTVATLIKSMLLEERK